MIKINRAYQIYLTIILAVLGLMIMLTVAQRVNAVPSYVSVWEKELAVGAGITESSPMPINFDGGAEDVIFGAEDGKVYILRGNDGGNVPNWPQPTANPIESTASSADVDSDGKTDIFIGSGASTVGECSGGGLYRFDTQGFVKYNLNVSDVSCSNPAIHSSPAIGDVNRDGAADITFGVLALKFWSVKYNGTVNSGWPYYWDDTQFASAALADVDGDGRTDVIMGGDSSPGAPVDHQGGMVRALRGDGTQIWQYYINEIVRSSPSIGDVDGDGKLEVVFGAGNYWGGSDATKIFVLDAATGVLEWSKDLNAQTLASPTLADFNGDGRLDIGIGTWSGADPGKVWLLDGVNGANLPNYPIASGGGVVLGQISTADIDGDGAQDPIVPTGGGVFIYNGSTGGLIFGLNQGVASYQNTPLVDDFDNDGLIDLVIAGKKPSGAGLINRYEFNSDSEFGSKGWHMFHLDQRLTGSWSNPPLTQTPVPVNGEAGLGYRFVADDGGVFAYGSSPFYGSTGNINLNSPIVANASKTGGNGYWLVASDGGIFAFGDAGFHGSTGNISLNSPIVSMVSTPSGNGYWLVAADGGIFSFGDAKFYGSTGAISLNSPIVSMMSTPSGNGYWLVAADGGIFSFGDAKFYGSTGAINLVEPIVGAEKMANGKGYWLVAADGGIFAFGNAPFYGSTGAINLVEPIVGMSRAATGGYWLAAADGGVFTFNSPFYGSAGNISLNRPIVGIATQGY